MTEPAAGAAIAAGNETYHNPDGVVAFGHPRRGLRAIVRYPLSTSTVEADRIFASVKPLQDGRSYPVAQGGIPVIGT